ncbi:hypothetical protein [Flavobacterium gawalongense]|uniref:Uncharacterized protein n=1 Tax=Flavobacterium gawalongense TaxID=2594432 RepID=A0A553BUF2_9FLAO|nr:hypothetical protein [Flavobacterium gawalongense]TRX02410.1 hypothetical protein FNW33_06250 [Flavobacterium gawalongense]TRX07761.1 hypothetical protein FNW12_05730 [Flavobacterium gawalongense]TRX11889.1 hypothetical protein FNW11_04765 [Flavobacterium gawalongense]TRX13069.1 hypothetical protein FNW10_03325 [Flavobacterium gawalongense]TRX30962.1 hypothetical protein FNW38_01925 [Flavobacterium gawalongense]
MNVIFIIIGMNVLILFLFDKSKLDNKEWFFKLLILNMILFLIALICFCIGFAKNTAVNSLFIPLIAQFVYYVLSKLFYLKYERNSVDTFWTMDKSLFIDGWFNFIFWLISVLLFLFVL